MVKHATVQAARRGRVAAARRGITSRLVQAVLGTLLVAGGGLGTIASSPSAAASSGPDFTLAETAPATVLYGKAAAVTLTGTDTDSAGSGATPGYNLSFVDVLPAGVSYVTGSTSGAASADPTQYANEPSPGETTLIWLDVADLQPASTSAISFQLQPGYETESPLPSTILYPGSTYSDQASAWVSTDPRYIPPFSTTTGAPSGGADFSDETASGTTEISPFEVTVTDPLPEHELTRGLHHRQTIWTVTVTNNSVRATALSTLDVWLPAAFEFLGCANVDNTTEPPATNPDDQGTDPTEEYPGSGPISDGNAANALVETADDATPLDNNSGTDCLEPSSTTTVGPSFTPPGTGLQSGVYTEVEWDTSGVTLEPGDTYTLHYAAAVPLLENTVSWDTTGGVAPSGASNDQIADLDNNSGPDTLSLADANDGQGTDETTAAQATGVYSGQLANGSANPASADGSDTDLVVDLAVQKTIATPSGDCTTGATFVEGGVVCFVLSYETSEYRYAGEDATFPEGVVLVDTLPNGLCPLAPGENYDQSAGGTANNGDCSDSGGASPSLAYAGVVENDGTITPPDDGLASPPPAGSFTVGWDLGTLAPDTDASVTFPAADRSFYQQYSSSTFSVSSPTVSGDSVSNSVEITGDTYATCAQSGGTPDPVCSGGGSPIYATGEPGATAELAQNPSQAAQSMPQPTIDKLIGVPIPAGGGGITCQGASYSASTTTIFQLGDVVCFQLIVTFQAGLYTREPVVADFLPPNASYDAGDGSGPVSPTSTVAVCSTVPSGDLAAGSAAGSAANPSVNTTGPDGDLLTWYLGEPLSGSCADPGDVYASPGDVFTWDVAATIDAPPSQGNTFELTQNLMKYASFDTAGAAVAERADVGYDLSAPDVTIVKGIAKATNAATGSTVTGSFDQGLQGTQVADSAGVTMRLDLSNWGEVPAEDVTVWDVLPVTSAGDTAGDDTCATFGLSDGGNVPEPSGAPSGVTGTCYDAGDTGVPTGIGTQTGTVRDTTIVWSVPSIAAASSPSAPGTTTLEYSVTLPPTATAGDKIVDQSGIVSYIGQPSTQSPGTDQTTYVPLESAPDCPSSSTTSPSAGADSNLDCDATALTASGITPQQAPNPPSSTYVTYPSYVQIVLPQLQKVVSPTSATPGEVVGYTLTATVPAGTVLDATGSDQAVSFTDHLNSVTPAQLGYVANSANATCSGALAFSLHNTSQDQTSTTVDGDTVVLTGDVPGSPNGNLPANSVTLEIEPPGPNGSFSTVGTAALHCTITFQAEIEAAATTTNVAGGTATNQAAVLWALDGLFGPGSGEPVDSNTTSVAIDEPALGLTKSDSTGGTPTTPGTEIGYTITVCNGTVGGTAQSPTCTAKANSSTAYTLAVSDPLPSGANGETYDNDAAGGASHSFDSSTNTISWTLNPLAPGSSTALTYSATLPSHPNGLDDYLNTATVTATSCNPLEESGITCADDGRTSYEAQGSDSVTVESATVTKQAAGNVAVGVDTTYTDTLTIPAQINFPDLDVVDVLPNGLSFDAYDNCAAPGDSYTDAATGLQVTCENTTTDSTAVQAASGETAIAWSFGDVTASATARTIELTYTAYPSESYTHSTTKPASSVAAGDQLVNTVTAFWDTATGETPPASAPNPSSTAPYGFNRSSPSGTATITVLAPGISITKTPASASLAPGATQTYTLTLCNGTYSGSTCTASADSATGDLDAVSDPLPSGETLVPGTITGGGSETGSTISWDLSGETLAPGATLQLGYEVTIGPSSSLSGASLTNTATVEHVYATDVATASGTPLRYLDYGSPHSSATVTPVFPDPIVTKYVNASGTTQNGATALDEPTSFHAVITDGTSGGATVAPMQDVTLTDVLPAYWDYVTGTTSIVTETAGTITADPLVLTASNVETLTWTGLGNLAQGEQITVTYEATPEAGATLDSAVTNTMTVDAEDGNGAASYGSSPVVPYSASSSAQDTVSGADLSVSKHHSTAFTAGAQGSYTLTVTNHGPDASVASMASPITLSDTLPNAESYVSATGTGWSCQDNGQTVTCTDPTTLASGSSAPVITLTVAVASSATGTIANDASVAPGLTGDPNPANNSTSDTMTLLTSADLSITKTLTAPQGGIVSGDDATYTLAVANAGPSDASAPEIEDVLPAGEGYVSASGTGWSCQQTSGTVTCTAAATLPSGQSESPVSLQVHVASSAVAAITNTAIVCSGSVGSGANPCAGTVADGTPDPDPANNTWSAPSSPSVGADLTITKTHSGDFPSGGTGSYTITASNLGPADSVGPITVVDTLPAGESYLSARGSGWTCAVGSGISVNVVTCTDPATIVADTALPAITLDVSVTTTLGTVTNTAEVIPGTTGDPDPANNTVTDPTVIAGADLSIAKTALGSFVPGQQASYDLTVSDAGPAASAPPVVVTDTLPAGESFVSATGTDWSCSASGGGSGTSSTSGGTVTCSSSAAVPAAGSAPPISLTVALASSLSGSLTNVASVAPGPTADPNPTNNSASVTTPLAGEAALAITKAHTSVAGLGGRQRYELTVTNNGPSDDPGPTTVTDPLPRGETYLAAVGAGWSCSAGHVASSPRPVVSCTDTSALPVGATAPTITLTVRLGASAYPSVTNTASVSGPLPNPTPSGASASDTLRPRAMAVLRLDKRLVGNLIAGGTATYAVTVANLGPSPAHDVAVSDVMPSGLAPLSGGGSGWSCTVGTATSTVSCRRALLAVGATSVITVTAQVTASPGTMIANQASVATVTPVPRSSHAVVHVVTPEAPVAPPAHSAPPLPSSSTTSTLVTPTTVAPPGSAVPARTTPPASTPPASTPPASTLPPSTLPPSTTTTVPPSTVPTTPASSSARGSAPPGVGESASSSRHPAPPAGRRRASTTPTTTAPAGRAASSTGSGSSATLAFTGLDLLPIGALGLGLMLLGAALVSLGREKRRRRHPA